MHPKTQPTSNKPHSPSSYLHSHYPLHQPMSIYYVQLHQQNNPHRHLSYSLMEYIWGSQPTSNKP